ncbi:MAG: beta-hydroxyacyl-ACP dehydratase [Betaproteobacteria bacterium]|nr:beta-hydroxyacyl-ACP dehydratase [Betaproteobacteria bacterium]
MNAVSLFPDITSLLPHRGAMLLLDRVVAFDNDTVSVGCRVRANAWYSEAGGHMPAWIGLELMAQAVVAHVSLLARGNGLPPKEGVLLGTRTFRPVVPRFLLDAELVITAHRMFVDASGLGAYDCAILCGGDTVAHATLKVFEPADFRTFIEQSTQ